ncbi:MAG: acetyl-CoA C-acetyltransferase [Pseudomonadota bacterium]
MAQQRPHKGARPVYIVDGLRTPFLKAQGVGPFSASELAVQAGRQLLLRHPIDPASFDEVVLGCVMPGPDEANIARVVALRLGCGDRVPAFTVQRNCASGMQALDSAARNIVGGQSDLVLAGGTEAMSHAPVLWNLMMTSWLYNWSRARSLAGRFRALAELRPAYLRPVIGLLRGLTDPVVGLTMGQTAEVLAERFDITRRAMDEYAVESHCRLAQAHAQGWMEEITPLYDRHGRVYQQDDGLRTDTTVERLARLKPVFDRHYGRVTAGNSAQITDGAAWLILASAEAVEKHDLPVLGRLVDSHWSGLDPAQMGLGPAHAMNAILKRRRLKPEDIDYWEINEAFAAQILACRAVWQDNGYSRKELGRSKAVGEIPHARLNVDGGGISLGHPVGGSGARIVLHLLRVMERHNAKRGIASLCIGGGQGGAMLLQRGEGP